MPPKPIKLVVSDIDGTIITSNHELTEATKRVASELQANGIVLTLASSRPPRAINPIANELRLKAPFAAFNGALIVTTEGGVIAGTPLSHSITNRVKAIADELRLDLWLYDEVEWYAPVRNAFVEREEHTAGFSAKIDGYAERLNENVSKLTVVGKPETVAEAERRVLKELSSQVSASRSKPRFLDITAYGMHKGTVVARLAELLGVSLNEVAVIGDGPNDIEMFRQAAISIALGQAVDEVRAHAKFVTKSNDDDGWALGIEKYVLNK